MKVAVFNAVVVALGDSWRKFFVVVTALMVLFLRDRLGIDDAELQAFWATVGTYLVGQGIADMGKGKEIVKREAGGP